ncbi:uncharacterized protein LOC131929568 [Physella acuta]|uniref:uncharacterized protein LOC131929568 n=1 Tax=Physella acuta TaxID=109671 RepID=UPI0027DC5B14|nr:uncharacterized protein LOC131929568 [Physella acuta]
MMAEKGQTSSMTSVTEEDTSADSESDTTESVSNVTSSLLSSTDTDDKLTPGLINISISNTEKVAPSPKKKRHLDRMDKIGKIKKTSVNTGQDMSSHDAVVDGYEAITPVATTDPNFVFSSSIPSRTNEAPLFPYGSNPLPLGSVDPESKKRRKQFPTLEYFIPHAWNNLSSLCKDNLGFDDVDNKLSTDYSDTSSIQENKNNSSKPNADEIIENKSDIESDETDDTDVQRPYHPDMTGSAWFKARCFDHYWTHYNFVMDWYRQHVHAVKTLQGLGGSQWAFSQHYGHPSLHRKSQPHGSKKNRRIKRARKRRMARAKSRQDSLESGSLSISAAESDEVTKTDSGGSSSTSRAVKSDEAEEEELEMEITDEMVQFFATSLKHKIERDNAKLDESGKEIEERINIEETKKGMSSRSVKAPIERPGARRSHEMKEIYGAGAPMIHGMETALQMMFDRISDKFQPKLWPNMPLKIVFD